MSCLYVTSVQYPLYHGCWMLIKMPRSSLGCIIYGHAFWKFHTFFAAHIFFLLEMMSTRLRHSPVNTVASQERAPIHCQLIYALHCGTHTVHKTTISNQASAISNQASAGGNEYSGESGRHSGERGKATTGLGRDRWHHHVILERCTHRGLAW